MQIYLKIKQILVDTKDNAQAILKLITVSKWKNNLPKIEDGKLIVLANGPSLTQNLDRVLHDFGSEHLMVCNFFYKSHYFKQLKPKYYTILDPSFKDITLKRLPEIKTFYLDLFAIVDWEMHLFLPYMYRKSIKHIIRELELQNQHIKISWYNSINFNGQTKFIHFLFGKKLGMPSPGNIAIPSLMLGIWMNFKEIALVGVELKYHHSVIVNEQNEFLIKEVHFYEDEELVNYRPIYLSHTKDQKMDTSDFFDMMYRIFNSLKTIKYFALKKGVKIVNYSKDSFIDQFEKV